MEIPAFVYGTAWKEERTAELAALALRAGFRGIDTANQRRHYFEAGVGEALEECYRAGVVARAQLFLQTKFTYRGGQDHRLPYDPAASVGEQVRQSLASSLEHLRSDYVDSLVLHGPASGRHWTAEDDEAWAAMAAERDAGRARAIGVSNVGPWHLEAMTARGAKPAFVQNRCFARFGWDREVRAFCRENGAAYQGFSLLTANVEVLRHPAVTRPAARLGATTPQVIFAFARAVGMIPLTGTSDPEHMRQDLAALELKLAPAEVAAIDQIAG